jgi:tetratricopeptide (TPR) repeat protein
MINKLASNIRVFRRSLTAVAIIGLLWVNIPKFVQACKRNLGLVYLSRATLDESLSLQSRGSSIRKSKILLQQVLARDFAVPERAKQLDLEHRDFTAEDFINIGNLWLNLDDFSQAESWYTQAIQLDQSLSTGWYKLGFLYQKQQRVYEAVSAYQRSITLNNFDVDNLGVSASYCHLGFLFRQDETIRDLARSQKLLETGLRLSDFGSVQIESDCYLELGNVLRWRNRRPAEYIEFYRRAVDLYPQNAQAYVMLGKAHYQLTGDAAQSENYIQTALAILPSVQAYQELAKIYEQEKEYDEAIEIYQRALRIEPENQSIQNALTSLQERSN